MFLISPLWKLHRHVNWSHLYLKVKYPSNLPPSLIRVCFSHHLVCHFKTHIVCPINFEYLFHNFLSSTKLCGFTIITVITITVFFIIIVIIHTFILHKRAMMALYCSPEHHSTLNQRNISAKIFWNQAIGLGDLV